MLKFNKILKRIFDIIVSVISLIILSPLFLVIAIAIKIDSKGPVLFKQGRRGKDGAVFNMFKFRSMVVDAENMGAGLFNYTNDPRVTKTGRILRNSSLDELPQIWNVLKGDMSIVGPRPSVTYELGNYETLNSRYKKRFNVLPGITGYAQIMGRNEISWDEKVNYDNKYIDLFEKQGILLDVKIILKTIVNIFKGKDIYEEKIDNSIDDSESAKAAERAIIEKAHAIEDIQDNEETAI